MSLKISRVLHAGYVIECDQTQVAFDPIFENPFSGNCHAFPSVRFDHEQIRNLKLDAVFISHFHDDHCSFESLNLLNRKTPIYVFCVFEELFAMINQLGFMNVHALTIDTPVLVGSIEVIPRRALDFDVDSIFHIKASGLNVLNVVDSWIDPEILDQLTQFAPWDLILWPFQTMRELEVIAPTRTDNAPPEVPREWIDQFKKLRPKYLVPSSCQFVLEDWSWYNKAFFPISYRQFERVTKSVLPNTGIVRLNPSVSVVLDELGISTSTPLSWIQPVGDQNVDYQFEPNLQPPTTAEIAKKFNPLSISESEKVYEYCRSVLLERFRSLPPSSEIYFDSPRFWRLSVFDHTGAAQSFYYQLCRNKIELSLESCEPLSWSTEVPISKLYAALEHGETLTSMYMRINDVVFNPEIETQVGDVDIVEDPLIRCLFNGVFGAYQKAQLKRLSLPPANIRSTGLLS